MGKTIWDGMSYYIIVNKGLNYYSWQLMSKNHKIIGSTDYTRKEMCLKTANKLARALKCRIEVKDILEDYEE